MLDNKHGEYILASGPLIIVAAKDMKLLVLMVSETNVDCLERTPAKLGITISTHRLDCAIKSRNS